VPNSNRFTMAMSAPAFSSCAPTMYAVKNSGIKNTLRELQDAITGLVSSSTGSYFVEPSGAYDTDYNLSALLGDGSYGSAWLSLKSPNRNAMTSVILQIQEALNNLTHIRNNVTHIDSADKYADSATSASKATAIEDAYDFTVVASPIASVSPSITLGGGHSGGSAPYTGSWTIQDNFMARIDTYSGVGAFVDGLLRFTETYTEHVVVGTVHGIDSFDIEDDGGNVYTLNVAANTSRTVDVVDSDTSAWWGSGLIREFTLMFRGGFPGSYPYFGSLATAGNAGRVADYSGLTSGTDLFIVRELVPGTHLTYG